jgi:hypothetical protein
MMTMRSPKRVLILAAATEKDKKGWINTLVFYAGTKEVLDVAAPKPRTETEKEKECGSFRRIARGSSSLIGLRT